MGRNIQGIIKNHQRTDKRNKYNYIINKIYNIEEKILIWKLSQYY